MTTSVLKWVCGLNNTRFKSSLPNVTFCFTTDFISYFRPVCNMRPVEPFSGSWTWHSGWDVRETALLLSGVSFVFKFTFYFSSVLRQLLSVNLWCEWPCALVRLRYIRDCLTPSLERLLIYPSVDRFFCVFSGANLPHSSPGIHL